MNFLGHALLAGGGSDDVLFGALIADGIKGAPDRTLSADVRYGITHHRRVDAVIDAHPETALLLACMPQRRFAGIALDMFWDHCLSRHYAETSDTATQQIIARCYTVVRTRPLPASRERMLLEMAHQRWLERYADLAFTCSAIRGLGQRFRRPQHLSLLGEWLEVHQSALQTVFFERLWPDLQAQCAL